MIAALDAILSGSSIGTCSSLVLVFNRMVRNFLRALYVAGRLWSSSLRSIFSSLSYAALGFQMYRLRVECHMLLRVTERRGLRIHSGLVVG